MDMRLRGRGFTLIELLVVVAIIAGLIAILVPSLSQVRRRASMVACAVNLRTLSQLDNQYGSENNGFIPRNSGFGVAPSIPLLFARMQRITLTPDPNPANSGTAPNFEREFFYIYRKLKWLQCPAFPNADMAYDYVTNGFDPAGTQTGIARIEMRRIHKPGELINFTEANTNYPTNTVEMNEIFADTHLNENKSTTVVAGGTEGRIATDKRHGSMINIGYFDTHVEPKEYKKVTPKDFRIR